MKAEFHLPSLGMVLDETVVQRRGSAHAQRPGDRKGLRAGDRVGRSLVMLERRFRVEIFWDQGQQPLLAVGGLKS